MESKIRKVYTLDEMKDKYVGERGTAKREAFEYELRMEMISEMSKKARIERHLTQEELDKLICITPPF